jgi:imidazoleglycerol-phosphate dehydratase
LSGRSFLEFDYEFKAYMTDDFETQNTVEFLRALAFNMEATIHIDVIRGKNDHHIIEAIFKALGAALKTAVEIDSRIDIMTTKGVI